MSSIFDNIPDVSFIDNETLSDVLSLMISDYQKKYKELTGEETTLALASPYRLILYACACRQYQADLRLDHQAKMNLLKYTEGDYEDNAVALFHVIRSPGTKAQTTMRFTLSAVQPSVISIPLGAVVTNGAVYFATTKYAEIAVGSLSVDVPAECTEIGTGGNGFEIGEINALTTSIPYIGTVSNITKTDNGTDEEDDDTLRERAYYAPDSFSVAGPDDAYVYFVKSYSSKIADVKITKPTPGYIDIRVILSGATLPDSDLITGILEYISGQSIRPLTDTVNVAAPTTVSYDVNVKYFINASDKVLATSIQSAVETAISEYITWQGTKIGRDINPDELIKRIKVAGAKRVVVTAPVRTVVSETSIPVLGSKTVTYGGLEDD